VRDEAPSHRVLNAMTIDVEDYFHVSAFDGVVPRSRWEILESRVCANTERMLEILDAAGVRGTFFVLGWVAERHPALVRRIAGGGHELASHGYAHRLVYDQSPAAFRDDVRRAKALIEDVTGVAVDGFRAPSYSITPRSLWALDILIAEGYRYDASIFPVHHDRYGIPVSARHAYVVQRDGGSLVEFPGSTFRCAGMNFPVAGGGYFRLLPYAWTRFGVDRLNRVEQRSAIFYIHPWEIDPDQPRLPGSLLSRTRHYRNLDKTESRLRQLLSDFRFGPLRSIMDATLAAPRADVPGGVPLPYHW
jgi:polysaccharide deacetylase family protein (PEP-CTERM system associated)